MFKQPEVQTLMLVACTPLYTNQNTSTEPALAHNSLYGLPTFIVDMNQNTSTEPALADYSLYGLPIFIVPLFFFQSISNNIDAFQGPVLQHHSQYPFGSNNGLMPDNLRI